MPINIEDKIKEILKTMVSFDIETDLEDEEAREELVNYFSEFVGSDSELTKAILPKLLDAMSEILVNMNIIEPKEETNTDAGEEDDLTGLGEPEEEETVESVQLEGIDMSKIRTCSDRANDFLM